MREPSHGQSGENIPSSPYITPRWEKIQEIKFEREGDFYDISVLFWEHYAAGGLWHHNSGKSYLALIFATILTLPWDDNPLGLEAPRERHRVLYLDYETDETSTLWRLKCLQKGENLGVLPIHYRRCALPLADDLEAIQEAKAESQADVIMVDSVGGACGAELNTAETALHYYGALRQLKSTSLSIAHTSKDQTTKHKTIYGNAYFYNYARNVFEVKRVQEAGEDTMSIGLFHRKNNMGKFYHPLGFKLTFGKDWVKISPQDVKDVAEFAEQLALASRIYEVLKNGDETLAELSNILGLNKEVLTTTLGRMKDKGRVEKRGDKKWGLPQLLPRARKNQTGGLPQLFSQPRQNPITRKNPTRG